MFYILGAFRVGELCEGREAALEVNCRRVSGLYRKAGNFVAPKHTDGLGVSVCNQSRK